MSSALVKETLGATGTQEVECLQNILSPDFIILKPSQVGMALDNKQSPEDVGLNVESQTQC